MRSIMEEKMGQNVSRVHAFKNPMEAFKQVEADNAALVEMLAEVYCVLRQGKNPPVFLNEEDGGEGDEESQYASILNLLAQPHPGRALVEQLAQLKQVANAARPLLDMEVRQDVKIYHDRLVALAKAFAELDGLNEEKF